MFIVCYCFCVIVCGLCWYVCCITVVYLVRGKLVRFDGKYSLERHAFIAEVGFISLNNIGLLQREDSFKRMVFVKGVFSPSRNLTALTE